MLLQYDSLDHEKVGPKQPGTRHMLLEHFTHDFYCMTPIPAYIKVNKITQLSIKGKHSMKQDIHRLCFQSALQGYFRLTCGFLLIRNFSVAISVSPHVCFFLVLILISMFLS